MKGLFPSAQLGASHLNAKQSGRARGSTHTRHDHLPVVCARCGEPADDGKLRLTTWLAIAASLSCYVIMLATCFVVQGVHHPGAYHMPGTQRRTARAVGIAVGVFLVSAMSQVAIACKAFGMSLRRMLFWVASLGGGAGLLSILTLKWTCQDWTQCGTLVVSFVMWGVLSALGGGCFVEGLRLLQERSEAKRATERIVDQKAVL